MQFETMMTEEMETAQIGDSVTRLHREEVMIGVGALPVHIVEIGVALTMDMDPNQMPDLNRGEVPLMMEERAQSTREISVVHLRQEKGLDPEE